MLRRPVRAACAVLATAVLTLTALQTSAGAAAPVRKCTRLNSSP
ncbi:hypothetical protein ACWC5I_48805 [Kitasatospora sp. NPDC001574]